MVGLKKAKYVDTIGLGNGLLDESNYAYGL